MSCVSFTYVPQVWTTALLAEWLRRTLKARVRKSVGSIPTECTFYELLFCASSKIMGAKMWRSRVSIPVPRACEARALPFELHPHTFTCALDELFSVW